MCANVRRYVALVRQLADGGACCPVPNTERSGCFCTRGALQGYNVDLFVLALAKTVTPRGVPRGSGAGRLIFARRLQPRSRADKAPTGFGVPVWRTGAQKPVEANDIYRPVTCWAYYFFSASYEDPAWCQIHQLLIHPL